MNWRRLVCSLIGHVPVEARYGYGHPYCQRCKRGLPVRRPK